MFEWSDSPAECARTCPIVMEDLPRVPNSGQYSAMGVSQSKCPRALYLHKTAAANGFPTENTLNSGFACSAPRVKSTTESPSMKTARVAEEWKPSDI